MAALVCALAVACTTSPPADPDPGDAAAPTSAPADPDATPSPTPATEQGSPSPSPSPSPTPDATPLEVSRIEGVTTTSAFEGGDGLERWQADVPGIADVRITSSADGAEQEALWLPPAEADRPLLVVLHSWSTAYLQHLGIPYAQWAGQNGWGMIHPNFRGVNETADSTGSALAVADVIDAVDYALAEGGGNPDQVFVIGFSGGGMMSLLMAGQHPDRFAGAVAWVPIHDLRDWYGYNAEQDPQPAYVAQIETGCGGPPTADTPAAQECLVRSPTASLDQARAAGLPIYIGVGLADETVPPSDGVRSFNQLADPADQFTPAEIDAIGAGMLPDGLAGQVDAESFFATGEPEVLLTRRSGAVTLVLFAGGHEMVFNAGLDWMARGTPAGS